MESKLFRLKRIKLQLWRFFPVLFLALALFLIIFTLTKGTGISQLKQSTISLLGPVISIIKEPVYWVRDGINEVQEWTQAYQENKRLKQEREELLKWRAMAIQLSVKQKELKKYLHYVVPKQAKQMMAEIAMDEGSAFTRSFVVDAGANQGVSKGMLAFSSKGLFARVVEVMPDFSRIMMVTDYMSRVPVWVGENKVSALLIGDNTSRPFLQFLNENETVQKGDMVITSGYVGVYPSGLLVGYVDEIQEDEVRVLPLENGEKLSVVRLIDFPLSKPLLKESE